MNPIKNPIKKPSQITALLGLSAMILSLVTFIINIYFSTEPTTIRAENLIDALYMLITSVLFLIIAAYFNHTGR